MRSPSPLLKASFALIALVSAAASCSARRVSGQENSLLTHARKVAGSRLLGFPKNLSDNASSYYWLSASRIREVYSSTNRDDCIVRGINLGAQQRTPPDTTYENLIRNGEEVGPGSLWRLRYILHSSGTFTIADKIDGSASYQMHFGETISCVWNQDGHRLYEFYPKSRGRTLIIERDLERPTISKRHWSTIPGLMNAANLTSLTFPTQSGHSDDIQSIVATNGHLMVCKIVAAPDTNGRLIRQVVIMEAGLGHRITLLRRCRLALPLRQWSDLTLAPDGRHLLWTIRPQHSWKINPPHNAMYRVSDLNGRHIRELGTMWEDGIFDGGATQMQWLPDSRHIGFLYKNELYTVATQ